MFGYEFPSKPRLTTCQTSTFMCISYLRVMYETEGTTLEWLPFGLHPSNTSVDFVKTWISGKQSTGKFSHPKSELLGTGEIHWWRPLKERNSEVVNILEESCWNSCNTTELRLETPLSIRRYRGKINYWFCVHGTSGPKGNKSSIEMLIYSISITKSPA